MNLDRKSLVLIFAATCALAAASQDWTAPPQDVEVHEGVAHAVSGDTLALGGEHIRLIGVDACKPGQTAMAPGERIDCGAWAMAGLEGLVNHADKVRCESRERGPQGPVAVCFAGRRNLNLALLREGYAILHDADHQPVAFRRAEEKAREDWKGVWAFNPVPGSP